MSKWSARSYEYQQKRKWFLKRNTVCWICGQDIDQGLRYPHPMSASVDHYIPASTGHNVVDMANWRAAHLRHNQQRGADTKRRSQPPTRPERAW